MSYIPGEERVTKMVDSPSIKKVYQILVRSKGSAPYGSTRFGKVHPSHGYVDRLIVVNLSKIQKKYPDVEFKIDARGGLAGTFMVMFRTKGSTGWHPNPF